MAYDPAVIRKIKRIGARRYGRGSDLYNRYGTAALATGIVESGLQNLSGGDADSAGWRQERASLYRNPTNIRASVNRFYDELEQFDRGQSIGELAADVQRPAAQYRSRYGQHLSEAEKLLGGHYQGGGSVAGSTPMVPGSASGSTAPNIFQTLASLNAPMAAQDPAYAQLQNGWNLLAALQERKNGQQGSYAPSTPTTSGVMGPKGSSKGSLEELFYDPLGGFDKGQSIGAIGGHGDHIHAGSESKALLNKIARMATRRGLTVREFAPYDKVDPVHTKNSLHYSGHAEDISGPAAAMMAFAKLLRRRWV